MTNYFGLFGRLNFGSIPRAQVGVLESQYRFWPELREIADGFTFLELANRQPPLMVQALLPTIRLALRHGLPVGLAQLGSVCQYAGVQVLLATDGGNRDPIHSLHAAMPELSKIFVAHGSVRVDAERSVLPLPDSRTSLLVLWGDADIETYRTAGIKFGNVVIGGSLRNAFYWRTYRKNQPAERRFHPIALVSKYSDGRENSPTKPDRSRLLQLMKCHVARYCRERDLPVRVLVRPNLGGEPSRDVHEREKQHYREVLQGVSISFSDPYLPYTTYLESDRSEVTVGLPSGSLTESFARGNKVLMIGQDPSAGDLYGFPKRGMYLLHEPDFETFAERLDLIREMDTNYFAKLFEADRASMVANANSDDTISIVQNLLAERIKSES